MSNTLSPQQRDALIKSIKEHRNVLRQKLKPELLTSIRQALANLPPVREERTDEMKIDRARNIRFVKKFLASPAGAHLRDKISLE